MSKCKSCNTKLYEAEMCRRKYIGRDPESFVLVLLDEYEDLCNRCRGLVRETFTYSEDKQYEHANLVEGLTEAKSSNY